MHITKIKPIEVTSGTYLAPDFGPDFEVTIVFDNKDGYMCREITTTLGQELTKKCLKDGKLSHKRLLAELKEIWEGE